MKGRDILEFHCSDGDPVQMVQKESVFDPKSEDLIKDAPEANNWAHVFADYASHEVVEERMEQFKRNLRAKKEREMCRDLYEAATLRLMLGRRVGSSFADATKEVVEGRAR